MCRHLPLASLHKWSERREKWLEGERSRNIFDKLIVNLATGKRERERRDWRYQSEPVFVIPNTSAVWCLSVLQPYIRPKSDGDSALRQANPQHRVCAPQISITFRFHNLTLYWVRINTFDGVLITYRRSRALASDHVEQRTANHTDHCPGEIGKPANFVKCLRWQIIRARELHYRLTSTP